MATTTKFAITYPAIGDDPYGVDAQASITDLDTLLFTHVAPVDATEMSWGCKGFGNNYFGSTRATALKYYGVHDRQNLAISNLAIENVGALPGAGASVLGKVVYLTTDNRLYVCTNAAVPTYEAVNSAPYSVSTVVVKAFADTPYPAVAGDFVLYNASGGGSTVQLPAAPNDGDRIVVKKTDASVNLVAVDGNGNNIDGAVTYTLNVQYESVTVFFGSGQWWVE